MEGFARLRKALRMDPQSPPSRGGVIFFEDVTQFGRLTVTDPAAESSVRASLMTDNPAFSCGSHVLWPTSFALFSLLSPRSPSNIRLCDSDCNVGKAKA